jgi:male-specific lethal 3
MCITKTKTNCVFDENFGREMTLPLAAFSSPPEATFEDGERVLCYEPDPTKVRVIYDAKILRIVDEEPAEVGGNKRNKAAAAVEKQYLVHFQGWSSSWDRFVPLDHLLKDLSDHRVLQGQLFEEAEECKREMKKSRGKKQRRNSSDAPKKLDSSEASEDSEVQFKGQEAEELPKPEEEQQQQQEEREEEAGEEEDEEEFIVPIEIKESLKRHLEEDMNRVVKGRKVNPMPADPNVVDVLERYVRHYASQQIAAHENNKSSARGGNKGSNAAAAAKEVELDRVTDAINVCKEIAEGLRVMMDFYTADVLLYESEVSAFKRAMRRRDVLTDATVDNNKELVVAVTAPEVAEIPKSPKSKKSRLTLSAQKRRNSATGIVTIDLTGMAAKLFETVGPVAAGAGCSSKDSSAASGASTPTTTRSAASTGLELVAKTRTNLILKEADAWRLLPAESSLEEPLASLVCGPIYLLRLYCRLPDILVKMGMSDKKTSLVVKYLESLLEFLDGEKGMFSYLYES